MTTQVSWYRSVAFALLAMFGLGHDPAIAQEGNFPDRPIRLIVPYPPGNTPDAIARVLGQRLKDVLGQTVVVENRPGAGGALGTESVVKSRADGYTLIMGDPGPIAISPAIKKDIGYLPLRDLKPVALVGSANFFLYANAELGISDLKGLIELAKTKPGELTVGTSGVGSIHHMMMEVLASRAGIKLVHVPYQGGSQSGPAAISGEVKLVFSSPTISGMADAVKAGKLKEIAVANDKRDFQLKHIPTFQELGIPGMIFPGDVTIYAPAGTPDAVAAKLADAIKKLVESPETELFLTKFGLEPASLSGEPLNARFKAEVEKYRALAKEFDLGEK